jgi:hypothetical protein
VNDRARWDRNPERHLRVRELRKLELARWMWQLKSSGSCTDCGGRFPPPAMQWDHVGTGKEIEISNAIRRGWGKRRILRELEHCELVCSNCHALRTYLRRYGDSGFHSYFERAAEIA